MSWLARVSVPYCFQPSVTCARPGSARKGINWMNQRGASVCSPVNFFSTRTSPVGDTTRMKR